MTNSFDVHLRHWLLSLRTAWLTDLLKALTHVGGSLEVDALVTVVAIATAVRTRRIAGSSALLAFLFTGQLLRSWLNAAIARPRPPRSDWLVTVGGHSMPSGHTFNATVGFGLIALLIARRSVWFVALGVAALVGVSRVYLGVHWPTDVIVAWLLGAGWLVLAVRAGSMLAEEPRPRHG